MKIQTSTDYAIRILRFLCANKGEMHPAMLISTSIGAAYPVFIRIATQLRQKGLLRAVPGKNGGYELGRPAHEISVYDALSAMEGDLYLVDCLRKGERCGNGDEHNCGMHTFFYGVQESMIAAMASTTIADLARTKDCPHGNDQIA